MLTVGREEEGEVESLCGCLTFFFFFFFVVVVVVVVVVEELMEEFGDSSSEESSEGRLRFSALLFSVFFLGV